MYLATFEYYSEGHYYHFEQAKYYSDRVVQNILAVGETAYFAKCPVAWSRSG